MIIALITGASSGIGAEFARQIDGDCELDEIWLIARREEKLMEVAAELENTKPVVIKADLCIPAEIDRIKNRLAREDRQIKYVVNSAGYGKHGLFRDFSLAEEIGMVDLNIRALTQICFAVIPFLRRGSIIINIASLAAFFPMPGLAVYAASKAFVLNFTEGLIYELLPRGIHAIAVCPGPVRTGFEKVAGDNVRVLPLFRKAKAGDVVRLALKHARQGKHVSIYGLSLRLISACVPRLFPRKLIARLICFGQDLG